MSRILVFMSDNRYLETTLEKAEYNSLVAAINYTYCKQHNYDFIYYRPYLNKKDEIKLLNCKNPVTGNLRHASWSKILSTNLSLQMDYDYVVYIDSDCIFKNFDQSLEDFIKPFPNNDILFVNDTPWNPCSPCAGFYICKVNDYVKCFLRDWYNTDLPTVDVGHPWEQGAIWDIFTNYNIGIIDSMAFFEMSGQFLRHIDGKSNAELRMPYFSAFLQFKNIDYEKNISEIRVVEFDTNAN